MLKEKITAQISDEDKTRLGRALSGAVFRSVTSVAFWLSVIMIVGSFLSIMYAAFE